MPPSAQRGHSRPWSPTRCMAGRESPVWACPGGPRGGGPRASGQLLLEASVIWLLAREAVITLRGKGLWRIALSIMLLAKAFRVLNPQSGWRSCWPWRTGSKIAVPSS